MKKILVFLLLLAGIPAFAQTGAVQGLCSLGGTKATTSGANSSNYLNGIIPSCTVTVYLTGTTTKATIYSNNLSTPLANPFTANATGSVNPGGWIFWAAPNAGLDVVLSGGIAPNTFTSPVTLVDVFPSSSFTPVAGLTNINGQTGPSITLQSSGATINVTNPSPNVINLETTGGTVSQIVAGTGISLSPAGGTGVVTVTNTGSFNPPTTNYVWVGDSRLMIATFNQVTATAASMDGTTVTITLPNVAGNWVDNAALVPGDSVQFFANAAWSPTCLAWGNGTVLTASATQITVAQNGIGPVTCSGVQSGTGGVVQKANYLIPQLTAREPYFNGHGTTYNMGVPGQTSAGLATQYTTYIHPLSPAVTGNPGYLFIQAGSQDALGCTAATTIESNLQSYWATAHADGWTIVMTTLITTGPTISCASDNYVDAVNYWLRSQVKGYNATLTAANKYWDQLVDVAEYVGDINDQNTFNTGSENLHLNNGGTKTISALMNLAMVAKGSMPPTPRAGYSLGERITDITGSFGAGRGQSTFAAESWNGNTTSGKFSTGLDHATSSPTTSVGAFWLPNNVSASEDLAAGYALTGNQPVWLAPSTGGYCWKNGTGGAFLSQQGTDSCFKRIAANEVAFGNGTSGTDFSGQIDVTAFKMAATAPVGACSPNGIWQFTQDGAATRCLSGTWTTFSGGGSSAFSSITSGTNATAAMVVGSGASMDYAGTGTIDANKLLTNTVPANSRGFFYNDGTGTLSWTLGPGATVKTTNYTVLTTDGGMFVMDCASACALTLPASSIPTGFNLAVQAVNTGAVTIAPNGNTIYLANTTGGTSSVTVPQGQTLYVAWDGTAFRATAPWLAGANVTITPSAAGVTVAASATGSTAFSALTGSTNTTAAMVVGTGASMSTSGTGTIQATNVSISVANAGTTGTTLNTLTKLTGAPSTAIIAATTDTGGVVGITTAGAGTTGSATVQVDGLVNCVFSGATTAGDYVQISSGTAGNCADAGATYPTSGQVIGRVLTTNVGAGTYQINLFPAEIKGGSAGATPIGYGFTLNTGVAASPAFPNQIAPRTGTITACKFLTQTSDGATALVFNIKENGVSILSGGTATIAAGTASQTITTLTLTGTISVTAGQIWEFDITGGTSTWTGSLTCY